MVERGVERQVLLPRENAAARALRQLDVPVLVAPIEVEPRWSTLRAGAELVQRRGVDVLHSHYTNAHVDGAIVAALTGRRAWLTSTTRRSTRSR